MSYQTYLEDLHRRHPWLLRRAQQCIVPIDGTEVIYVQSGSVRRHLVTEWDTKSHSPPGGAR